MPSKNPLDDFHIDEADDLGPKCACLLLLDTSTSMESSGAIAALNAGLRQFQQEMEASEIVQYRVDVAVVTFGDGVEVAQEFIPAADFTAAELSASGSTPMGEAINKALDMLEERKDFYRLRGNPVYRPWIFMITDGGPTDSWENAAARLKQAEKNKSCIFYAVGVEGADFTKLEQIVVRKPLKLRGLAFGELFVWLSNSLSAVSGSRPGERVELEKPSSDFVID